MSFGGLGSRCPPPQRSVIATPLRAEGKAGQENWRANNLRGRETHPTTEKHQEWPDERQSKETETVRTPAKMSNVKGVAMRGVWLKLNKACVLLMVWLRTLRVSKPDGCGDRMTLQLQCLILAQGTDLGADTCKSRVTYRRNTLQSLSFTACPECRKEQTETTSSILGGSSSDPLVTTTPASSLLAAP